MEKILKGYWACKYCGSKDLDGLVDSCPNCGKQKSEDVKYYLLENSPEVTKEELEAAGISTEECDGEHREWICNYCNQLNNYADEECVSCGALKEDATHEYNKKKIVLPHSEEREQETLLNTRPKKQKLSADAMTNILIAIIIVISFGIACYLLQPIEKVVAITGFAWQQTITVEEERTVQEDGWSVPDGGRVYDSKWTIRTYKDVLDHYETVTEQKSRQVISHYETVYSYRDNGNGTFTQTSSQKPVYKTEYYTVTRQEPVYRKEPVYDTKYYYEIERWFDTESYTTSGTNHEPYWSTEYVLGENERDSKRSGKYVVYYNDDSSESLSLEKWERLEIGDTFTLTVNRMGGIYSKEAIN